MSPPINELDFVDEDIRALCKGRMFMPGHPTQMQLVKELRLLREALSKIVPEIQKFLQK